MQDYNVSVTPTTKRWHIIAGITFTAVLLLNILSAQAKESVAVMDMEGRGISTIEAQTLTDRMRSELVRTGAVTVVERGQMQQILEEQDFQMSGCTSDECAVEVGQLLGVTKIMAGSIGKIGSTYTIDLRVIDIATGAIGNTMTRNYRGEIDGLIAEIEHISWELVGLVHPDLLVQSLREEPAGIDPAQAGRQARGRKARQQSEPQQEPEPRVAKPKKKGGMGRMMFRMVLLAGIGGGGYYAYTTFMGGNGGEPIGSPPPFPTVP